MTVGECPYALRFALVPLDFPGDVSCCQAGIAGPGFGVDENMETLGEKVALPPFLEPERAEIVANLEPID